MTDEKQPSGSEDQGTEDTQGGDTDGGTKQPTEPIYTPSDIGEYEIREGDRGKIVRKSD